MLKHERESEKKSVRKKVFFLLLLNPVVENMSEVVQDKVEQVEAVVVEEQAQEATPVQEELAAIENDDIVMEETETTPVVEQPPNVHAVLAQLKAIFDPENLAKDNFFRELVERDAEGCKFYINVH